MDDQQYQYLVRRLELEAHANPARFRSKVLAVSGVAYLTLALALVLMAVLGALAFHLARDHRHSWLLFQLALMGLGLLGILYTVLRAFLTRLPPPAGRELQREEAPRLFELIDRVRAKLDGPPLHRVIVDRSFNAAIAQVPRFGLFGGHRNHLVLGLPYLLAMSTREMAATLAHEYGHLAGAHGKMSAWVYRQRLTFGALMDKVQDSEGNWFNSLLHGGLRRFAPYFNACTFVLSREHEYEADAAASRAAGRGANARGLCRGELAGRWFAEDFWPQVYAQAGHRASPQIPPFAALRTAFVASQHEWSTEARLREALARGSDLHDTHPCLRDRLDAIGHPAALPPPVEHSAAETLLGSFIGPLLREFDEAWWAEERTQWQAHYRQQSDYRRKVMELSARPLAELGLFDLQEYASALAGCGREADALPVLEHLLGRDDSPLPRARLLYGRLLLAADDGRGLDELARAAAADERLGEQCAQLGYAYLAPRRGAAEAARWADAVAAQAG